jgi:hypothetical protein
MARCPPLVDVATWIFLVVILLPEQFYRLVVNSRISRSWPRAALTMIDGSFIPYFLSEINHSTPHRAHALYMRLVLDHFDEFIDHASLIPTYPHFFDLMKIIPIDPSGCPRNRPRSLVDQASISPGLPPNYQQSRMTAFIMLIQRNTSALYRFIHFLTDPDFVFFLVFDSKIGRMGEKIAQDFKKRDDVFVVSPHIRNAWGDHSLVLSVMIAFSAILKTGVRFQWVSLHSETDVASTFHGFRSILSVYQTGVGF